MRIIWRRKAVTVCHVYEELLEHRRIAYTSVMTVMKAWSGRDICGPCSTALLTFTKSLRPKTT